MKPIAPEAINDLRQLLEGEEPPEQSSNPEGSVPWEEKRPLSWSEFLLILNSYCEHRGWELLSAGPGDLALTIFAHEDKATGEAEVRQGRLPFEEDALPF